MASSTTEMAISPSQARHNVVWALAGGCVVIAGAALYYVLYASVQRQVGEYLVDARSAIFKTYRASFSYYCAEVNSRNRMGGYAGFRKVIAKRGSFVMFDDGLITLPPLESSSFLPAGEAKLAQLDWINKAMDKDKGKSIGELQSAFFQKTWGEVCR